jgi:hypothetical protein
MLNWNEFAIWAGYAGTAIVVIAYTMFVKTYPKI